MTDVISQTKDSSGIEYFLRTATGGRVSLECSRDRGGSPRHPELPRTYDTPRGARRAAAMLAGEKLTWATPVADVTPGSVASSEADQDAYWRDIMSRRMPFHNEVSRLATVLRGIHAQEGEGDTLLEFSVSRAPYGTKNIPAAIAYHLGWDYARRLCTESMPAWVEDEARALHAAVVRDVTAEAERAGLPQNPAPEAPVQGAWQLNPMACAPKPAEDEYFKLLVLDEWTEMGMAVRGWKLVHWLDAFDGRPAGWYGSHCNDLRHPLGWVLSTTELASLYPSEPAQG